MTSSCKEFTISSTSIPGSLSFAAIRKESLDSSLSLPWKHKVNLQKVVKLCFYDDFVSGNQSKIRFQTQKECQI